MEFLISYFVIAAICAVIACFGRMANSDHRYYESERKARKFWSQMLLLSPVWPIALVYVVGRSLVGAYHESGFDEVVDKWRAGK